MATQPGVGDEGSAALLRPDAVREEARSGRGADIDFDRIYEAAVQPGIEDAGMLPIRADEEKLGGIVHQAMYERLLLCDFAVADLTTANPNVLYELGIPQWRAAPTHPLP